MKYIHSRQIIHNHLDPNCILLDSELHPYLSEFHYAKYINDSGQNDEKLSSDVFDFGLILFCLIAETDPFTGLKPEEKLEKINNISSSYFPSDTNTNWIDLIMSCCSNNPNERPSFSSICETLEEFSYLDIYFDGQIFDQYKKIFEKFKKNDNYKIRRTKAIGEISLFSDNDESENELKVEFDYDLNSIPQDF